GELFHDGAGDVFLPGGQIVESALRADRGNEGALVGSVDEVGRDPDAVADALYGSFENQVDREACGNRSHWLSGECARRRTRRHPQVRKAAEPTADVFDQTISEGVALGIVRA